MPKPQKATPLEEVLEKVRIKILQSEEGLKLAKKETDSLFDKVQIIVAQNFEPNKIKTRQIINSSSKILNVISKHYAIVFSFYQNNLETLESSNFTVRIFEVQPFEDKEIERETYDFEYIKDGAVGWTTFEDRVGFWTSEQVIEKWLPKFFELVIQPAKKNGLN